MAMPVELVGVTTSGKRVAVQVNDDGKIAVQSLLDGDIILTTGDSITIYGKDGSTFVAVAVDATGKLKIGESALPTGASTEATLVAVKTAAEIMDDWDEVDRAKVNPIAGQAGVAGGSGVTAANVQRVVLATDIALPAGTNAIGKLAANSGVDIGDVDVLSSALPTGASTEASLAAVKTAVEIIDNFISGSRGLVTEDNSAAIKTALELIDNIPHGMNAAFSNAAAIGGQLDDAAPVAATEGNVAPVRITAQRALHTNLRNDAGTEIGTSGAPVRTDPTGSTTQPVSAASLPLPTGAATETTLAAVKTAVEVIDNFISGSRGLVTEDNSAAIKTALELIDNLAHGMNAAFSNAAAIGGQLDDVTPVAATEGNISPVRITAQRALHTNLRNDAGTEIGISGTPLRIDPTGTTTQPISVASLPLPTGAATEASLASAKTAVEKLDDIAHTGQDAVFVGSAAIGGQLDDAATVAVTENQIAPIRITTSRGIHTNLRSAAGTEVGTSGSPLRTDPTGTTTQPVSAASLPLPTGAAAEASLASVKTAVEVIDNFISGSRGLVTEDNSAAIKTALELIDNLVHAGQDAVYSSSIPIGGQLDDAATVAVTENQIAPARITPQRGVHVQLRTGTSEAGTSGNPLRTDPTGTTSQPTQELGAANIANNQVTLSTTSAEIVAARALRKSVNIRNIDATISVYVGAGTVSATNGYLLKAGDAIELKTTAAVNGIAASGSPKVSYIEEYN